jgi:hypothetical protein
MHGWTYDDIIKWAPTGLPWSELSPSGAPASILQSSDGTQGRGPAVAC